MSPLPNYVRALRKHLQENPPERGAVEHVEIRHDDWCRIFEGGTCDCEPVVESGTRIDRKYGGGR